MGILTGKFGSTGPWPEGRENIFDRLDTEQLTKLLQVLKNLSTKHNIPQSSVALNWCIVKGSIPLGGARTAQHVEDNAKALGWRLTQDEVADLDQFAFLGENNKQWQHG